MTIKEQQSRLFDEWGHPIVIKEDGRKIRPGFRADGVINEDIWNEQATKVMFILKETNSGEGSLAYDLGHLMQTRHLASKSKVNTWSNISCWLAGIQATIESDAPARWKDFKAQGEASKVAVNLQKTVILNLKKSPGGARSNDSAIEKDFAKNRDFFKRQYDLYSPDIVVCCGPVVTRCIRDYSIITDYDAKHAHSIYTPLGGIWCYTPSAGPIVIGYFHPQCSLKHDKLFSSLIEVTEKTFNK